MSKLFKESPTTSLKQICHQKDEYVIEKIARIDGNQTVRKYKKGHLLGKGGFANCFVTQNAQTKKKAATKIIEKQLLTSQKTKLRLLNEIRLHKTLHHENVVEFVHYFEDKNNVYIFLELCQNESLNEVIKARQSFTTPEIQSFMYGIIKGLKYLHGKSIIHRDLKLGNIFLDKNFVIKLGDFGLATKLEFRKECKRTICGTPNYIAPQILEGKGYHFEVDIWSIGVILYTLYFTFPPFETEEASTTYQKIKKCQYFIPKYGYAPDEAIDLIRKILVKNPWERPTLDDILNSDFMKLGNKIYKELPAVCSRRSPMKKDLQDLPFWTHQDIMDMNVPDIDKNATTQETPSINPQNSNLEFIEQFESLNDGKYFYILNNGVSLISSQNQVIFKDEYGSIKAFNPNEKSKAIKICEENPLKCLLNCKTKLKSSQRQSSNTLKFKEKELLFEATLYPTQIPLHIKKVSDQSKHKFYMVRLSNNTVQMIFEDGIDYLISGKGDLINEIKNGKVSETFELNQNYKIDENQGAKIDQSKLKFIVGVLNQIKSVKQKVNTKGEAKQNIKQATVEKSVKQIKKDVSISRISQQGGLFREIQA